MTTVAPAHDLALRGAATTGTGSSALAQFQTLSKRSLARTLRDQKLVVPSLLFPLFNLAVFASVGARATRIPHFPTHSFLTFMLGATFIQGALQTANITGTLLAADFESGYISRTLLTPVKKAPLVLSQLTGPVALVLISSGLFLAVGLIAGADLKAGVLGGFAVIGVTLLIAMTFASIGLLLGSLARSAVQVQGLTAILLVSMFLSSMLMPRNLITHQWFKDIATYNPTSYLVEATRSLLITGWDAQALALGCGFAIVAIVISLPLAALFMRRRLERT
jgi:ABC-2 type transport system permease protein